MGWGLELEGGVRKDEHTDKGKSFGHLNSKATKYVQLLLNHKLGYKHAKYANYNYALWASHDFRLCHVIDTI